MEKESRFWAGMKKAGVVAAVLGPAFLVWDFLKQPSEELKMLIQSSTYELSPDLEKGIKQNFEMFEDLQVFHKFKEEVPPEALYQLMALENSVRNLHKESWQEISLSNFNNYKGIHYAELRNDGNKNVTDVEIDLKASGLARLTKPDHTERVFKFKGVIPVGDIRAGTESNLTIWTDYYSPEINFERINLTHADGKGNVDWSIPVSGLHRLIIDNLWIAVLCTPNLILIFVLFFWYFKNPR